MARVSNEVARELSVGPFGDPDASFVDRMIATHWTFMGDKVAVRDDRLAVATETAATMAVGDAVAVDLGPEAVTV